MTAWAVLMAAGLVVAGLAMWPRTGVRRRRGDEVHGVRWRHDPETGLRDYYATPWLRGDDR